MTDKDQDVREELNQDDAAAVEAPESVYVPDSDEEGDFEWTEPPRFEVERKENCVCEVKVLIPVANIATCLDEVYREVNDGAQIPGFRRGKAPRKLLEKRLGKYARRTVVERLADSASKRLLKEHDLQPISTAEIEGLEEPENLPEDQDIEYLIRFEVPGTCEPCDYKSFELERPEYVVDEADVEQSIENMRTRFGRYEPLEHGVAQDGDQVIIDFLGTLDGVAFEGGNAENYPYILGSGRFAPEMEQAMQGAKAGEEKTTQVTFPEDYREESLAGKTADFTIKINELKRRVLPELDDEFAKKVGHDTVAELRESVRQRIIDNTDDQIKEMLKQQAIQKLVEGSAFVLPQGQVDNFVANAGNAMRDRLARQHFPAEEIEKEKDSIDAAASTEGLFECKSMYAVMAIAKTEGLEVTEADFETYARSISGNEQQYELMKQYLSSGEARNISEFRILEGKVAELIIENATIKMIAPPAADAAEEGGDKADE